jgi:hypothetical protein
MMGEPIGVKIHQVVTKRIRDTNIFKDYNYLLNSEYKSIQSDYITLQHGMEHFINRVLIDDAELRNPDGLIFKPENDWYNPITNDYN